MMIMGFIISFYIPHYFIMSLLLFFKLLSMFFVIYPAFAMFIINTAHNLIMLDIFFVHPMTVLISSTICINFLMM